MNPEKIIKLRKEILRDEEHLQYYPSNKLRSRIKILKQEQSQLVKQILKS